MGGDKENMKNLKDPTRYPFIRKLKRLNTTETLPVLNFIQFFFDFRRHPKNCV